MSDPYSLNRGPIVLEPDRVALQQLDEITHVTGLLGPDIAGAAIYVYWGIARRVNHNVPGYVTAHLGIRGDINVWAGQLPTRRPSATGRLLRVVFYLALLLAAFMLGRVTALAT